MKYLLDTNACTRFLNGRSEPLRDKIRQANPEDIFLCSVVKAELFYGAMKSRVHGDFVDAGQGTPTCPFARGRANSTYQQNLRSP